MDLTGLMLPMIVLFLKDEFGPWWAIATILYVDGLTRDEGVHDADILILMQMDLA